jgi:hypothetical protein
VVDVCLGVVAWHGNERVLVQGCKSVTSMCFSIRVHGSMETCVMQHRTGVCVYERGISYLLLSTTGTMVPGYMWYMYFLSGVKYHRITSLYSAYNNTCSR